MMKRVLMGFFFCLSLLISVNGQTPVTIGNSAPDFVLKDLRGQSLSLKDLRGKTAVVVFLSTECPFSNAYHRRLLAIASDYAKQNVIVLGINSHPAESLDEIREHAKKNHLDFPILKDEGSRVADAYGATRTPEVFVVDAGGSLRYHGRIDNSKDPARVKRDDLREALDEMIAGKPVSVPETKSFGCPIKIVRPDATTKSVLLPINDSSRATGKAFAFTTSFVPQRKTVASVPQKKTAARRAPARKPATSRFTPHVAALKPAEFAKFKESVKGQVLVINFWATWCGPCVAEFPEFVALDAKYRDKGVKIVGISADEVAELKTKVIAFLKEQKAPFQNFVQDTDDPQQMIDIVDKDWAGILPATFVFDKQGTLIFKHYGIINRDDLVAVIEKAM